MSEQTRLVDVPERSRFEFFSGTTRIGLADYRDHGSAVSIPHTEIDPAYGGHGLGTAMVRGVLDALRGSARMVLPDCPFVRKVIVEDPGYLDLVPAAERAAYRLPAEH